MNPHDLELIEIGERAGRKQMLAEIVEWLRTKDNYDFDDLAIDLEAKFGGRDVAD
jgi:hypothetical protein